MQVNCKLYVYFGQVIKYDYNIIFCELNARENLDQDCFEKIKFNYMGGSLTHVRMSN